jgi:hypothetical protein
MRSLMDSGLWSGSYMVFECPVFLRFRGPVAEEDIIMMEKWDVLVELEGWIAGY